MTTDANSPSAALRIEPIDWQATLPVRHQVLWPDRAPSFSKVENDEQGLHFGGFMGNELVCVASIFISDRSARLRKYATLAAYQGQGIGSQVLNAIFNELKQRQINYFWCDARESAIGFYQRFGMQVESERFFKSKVAYVKMGCVLG